MVFPLYGRFFSPCPMYANVSLQTRENIYNILNLYNK